jgi:FAD/FMN-containing dehydrogenase
MFCENPADVTAAIELARRRGATTSTRSGGHCFAGYSSDGAIVIDVSPMNSVSITGDVATVSAGTRLGPLYQTLATGHRTIAGGCGATVGISGLTLGGGLGILGRRYGLTCDQVLAAQVVLADGSIIECDEQRDPDLFWALRGAGASFPGVVTSLTFRTLPEPWMTAFHLLWPHIHAANVIEAWQAWLPAVPPELSPSLLITAGQHPAVNVFGAMLGPESGTANLLDDLVARVGFDPARAVGKHMPYRQGKDYLAVLGDQMRANWPRPAAEPQLFVKSEFFARPLPPDAIAALVATLYEDRPAGEARELDFSPWGGAYTAVPSSATAFVHRDALFLLKHAAEVAGVNGAASGWPTRSWELAHPWGTGGVYPNFPDPELADAGHAYYGGNLGRLMQVRKHFDPDGFFRLRT